MLMDLSIKVIVLKDEDFTKRVFCDNLKLSKSADILGSGFLEHALA